MATKIELKTRLFPTHIDIPAERRGPLTEMLNQHLADTLDLYSQVKQAHWNVKGKDFYQLHLLFDQIAEEVDAFIDDIAERITSLGGYANGTARMAAENSELPEYPTDITEGMDHVRALVERLAIYAQRVRQGSRDAEELEDYTTGDLYNGISQVIDKRLWFLEAHLQPAE